MQIAPANPFLRADTLTGTCQAIGEDFGFNPLFLRLAFALGLFWSAGWTAAIYLALGAAVLASRLLFPTRRQIAEATQSVAEVRGDNDDAQEVLAEAA